MKITINSIEHKDQRYPTVGDWFYEPDGSLTINVSRMQDSRYELLVAIHELIEAALCEDRGITQDAVDQFDKDFEENRHSDNLDEPGDDPRAPYRREHCFATGVERLLAAELEVAWKTYESFLDLLP